MSNRRNFLGLMAGTASLGVLYGIGKGVVASDVVPACIVDNGTVDVAGDAIREIGETGKVTQAFVSQVASADGKTITALSSKVKKANDVQIAFWSKSSNVTRFVRSAAADEQKKAAQSLKDKYSEKQMTEAIKRALANLKKNNISAIESDPIIGPVVKAGYLAASKKMQEAAAQQKKINALRKDLRGKIAIRVEAESVKLKKGSKITNKGLQEIAKLYPSLAPSLKKALAINVQSSPGINPPNFGIPVMPGQLKQQLKSDATTIEQSSLNNGDAGSEISTSNQNRFDAYAQVFESRLSAVTAPINGEANLTLVDRLLGIEQANACELICLSIILAIVATAGIVAIVGIVATSEADKNEVCKELLLKENVAAEVAACEERANVRRRERLAAELKSREACVWGFFCDIGHANANNDIEDDYTKDVDACS